MNFLTKELTRLGDGEKPSEKQLACFAEYCCGNCTWRAKGRCDDVRADKLYWRFPRELACSSYRCKVSLE